MSAAAMFSLGAQAAKVSLVTGTGFNNYAGDWDPAKDDNGTTTGTAYWTGGGGDSAIMGDPDKYLKVDETEALTRQIKIENDAVAPQTVTSAGGVYFSSRVQFTAADDAPEVVEGVDKIIVWAKAPDDGAPAGTTTNLMVTALDLTEGENYGNPTVYETGVAITADTWYMLDIVAAAQDGDSPIAFTVSLDGTTVGTYNSMVTSGGAASTISSVSFKGTGAVDDIDWGTVTADAPVPVEVSWTITGATVDQLGVVIGVNSIHSGDEVNVGETLTFIVMAEQGSSVTANGLLTFAWSTEFDAYVAEYTLTAADGEAGQKAFAITVTEGGAAAIVPNMDDVPSTVTFSPEFAASYTAGDTIDPRQITASTSKGAGYTVSFEILVNGTKITTATTLNGTETITVTATETAIEYTITYTYVDANSNPLTDVENTNTNKFTVEDAVTIDSAKISKEGYTVTSVTPATIAQGTTENQTVAVVLTAVPTTYTVTAAAVEGATVTFSTTDPVVSGTTVTFTIAVTDDTKEIDTVKNGETELTANEGVYSVTVVDADIVITVTLKNKSTPAGDWPATWNSGAAATPAQAAAFTEWAKTNDATAENAQAAFLTGQDVANYKEVTFTSITIADNKVVLTENVNLSKANGVVKIKYGTTPTSLTNTAELGAELPATAAAQFYKIVVDFQ